MRALAGCVLARAALVGATAVAAGAAVVLPASHSLYLGVAKGHFEIQLKTGAATQISAGVPKLKGGALVSSILVVCPVGAGGLVTELHVGFPGARLAVTKHRLGFARSYTFRHAALVAITSKGFGKTTIIPSVRASVTGVVTSSKLITGTVSVSAPDCSLRRSTYKAPFFRSVP